MEEKKENKPTKKDFIGKVVEIHSGDSLTIENEIDNSLIRVFLATVKAPLM
jgi:endonuclease YncB( thermonuclease family)